MTASNLEILAYEHTELGALCLRRRELLSSRYDLILVDIDHAPDDRLADANGSFYTEEGLERARRHLAQGGVLGVWSWAESSDFSRALRAVFDEVRVEPVTFFVDQVDEERTDWLIFGT